MNERHLSDDDLGALDAAVPGDPRRIHLETCPKCRARWLDYVSFMEGEALPPEARADEARQVLRDTIGREYATPAAIRPRRAAFLRSASAWAGQWLAAAAALVIVTAAGWWLTVRPASRVLRGPSTTAAAPLALRPVAWQGDSAVVLRWRGHPRADRYEVRLFGSDLAERARFDAGPDTELLVRPGTLTAGPADLVWRVAAMHAGAEVGLSDFGAIPRH